jgi:hypothetical protein
MGSDENETRFIGDWAGFGRLRRSDCAKQFNNACNDNTGNDNTRNNNTRNAADKGAAVGIACDGGDANRQR